MTSPPDPLSALTPEQRAAFELLLRRQRAKEPPPPETAAIPRRGDPAAHPLSFAQQRLWFLDQLAPGDPAYNIHGAVRLRGALDPGALARALSAIAARHEPLRARFPAAEGQPVQRIDPPAPVPLPVLDLGALPAARREPEVLRLAVAEARRPFDLARGPLLRAALLRAGPADQILLLAIHHIAADGWSIGVLLRELTVLYAGFAAGRPAALPPLPIAYSDFAAWQRERLRGERLAAEVEHWRAALAGLPELRLPSERPTVDTGSRGLAIPVALPPDLVDRLKALGRSAGASLFMTLLAVFELLLSRWTGQRDFGVGAPVANRTRPELEGLIGFFVNTLVLRAGLMGDPPFLDLLARVERTVVDALSHQELPFEKLVEELHPERRLGRTPLFTAVLALQSLPPGAARLPGLEIAPIPVRNGTARFDLTLSLEEESDGLAGNLEIRQGVLTAGSARRMAGHLRVLLEGVAAGPGRPLSALPLLTAAEQHQILVEWAGPERGYPLQSLAEMFVEQAARTPDAIAVVCGASALSYGELDRRAAELAGWLRQAGAGAETAVAISVERSPEMVVGLIGILKAGAAYLPIDPENPRERQAFLLDDGGAAIVLTRESITDGHGLPRTSTDLSWTMGPVRGGPWGSVFVRDEALPIALLYTSGSTGRPKATVLPRRGFLNLCLWFGDVCPIRPHTRSLLGFSFSFDAAFKNILVPLLVGGRTVLPPPGPFDARERLEVIRREGVTFLNTTPGQMVPILHQAAADGWTGLESLETLILGGEAPRWEELRPWLASGRCRAEILHMYGPSEVSDTVSCHRVTPEEIAAGGRLPVGRAADNTRMVVVDADLSPLPIGVPGELCLAGDGLARGYLARPELTAEKIVPDPRAAGARRYRTGDLARWRADGALEILGRIDHQLKIRGIRVEPPEVEAVLVTHPTVGGAVVGSREDAAGEKRLIAWIVPAPAAVPPAESELRALLRERLPEVMIPAAFVVLEKFPLNPRGKIDRNALPAPGAGGADRPEEGAEEAPRGPAEELMAGLWAEVLEREPIGRGADFFHQGGHSLLATRLVARVRAAFGVELPVRKLFEHPTVAELTAEVRRLARPDALPVPPPRPRPHGARAPLSFAQRRLWLLHQLEPGLTAYHIPAGLRLRGRLDEGALDRALGEIIRRHEALRTSFPVLPIVDTEPVQEIAPAAGRHLAVVDLSALPEEARETAARRGALTAARRPFDLERGPLLRLHLLRLGVEDHILFLVVHHLVSDGWSTAVFLRELSLLYAAFLRRRPSPLPEPVLQYADWALWQREWLRGEVVLEAQLRWWRDRLDDAPRVLDLPTDFPRPPVESQAGAAVPVRLPAALVARLRRLAREERATLYMVLLAAFQALLARRAGTDTVCTGTHVAGRDRLETEDLIGFFVNTLVIRVDLNDGVDARPSGHELIGRVREAVLGAFAHQELPFEKLVEALQPVRDPRWSPLYQAAFTLQNAPREDLRLPGLDVEALEVDTGTVQLDLALTLAETPEGAAGGIRYRTALFAAPTLHRLVGHYEALLESLAEDAGRPVLELPILAAEERSQVVGEWSGIGLRRAAEPAAFPALFEARVDLSPDAPAVVAAGRTLTYRELDRRANRLARSLRRRGIGTETRVALRLDRSPEMLVALLGIWKAGAAWVPVDPTTPPERLDFLRLDAGVALVLATEDLAGDAPTGDRLGLPVPPGQLAYVIYTSGSTGRPKGVMITHASLMAFARGLEAVLSPVSRPGMRLGLNASLAFDASLQAVVRLLAGDCVWIVPEEARRDEELMADFFRAADLDGLDCTPSQIEVILAAMETSGRFPRFVLVGGEAIPPALWQRLAASARTRFWNVYGPTECTVNITARRIEGASPDAGRPWPGTRLWLLEATGEPAPAGARAEVWAGGPQVARGYLDRPDLTADRFRPDPFSGDPGARLYRTGDLGCWLPDGRIELLGRADQQVKLRGHRIELGEIEAQLLAHPLVREAAAGLHGDAPGGHRLAAWVVPAVSADAGLDLQDLRRWIGERLPGPMVPAVFVEMDALPKTVSGKLDRRGLPDPGRSVGTGSSDLPADPLEQQLLELFREVLGVERVALFDSLFDLGGHSLTAFRLATRIRAAFGVRLAVHRVFTTPTPAGLAAVLRGMDRDDGGLPPVRRVPRDRPLPLSLAQQRLWVLHQLAPGLTAYHLPAGLRLRGSLDIQVLAGALTGILRRHEALRTHFPLRNGEPVQEIDPAAPVLLPVLDLAAVPAEDREKEARRIASAEARRPFDLARGPLLRLALLRLDREDHVLLLVVHHLVSDGWSSALFLRELSVLYGACLGGEPSPLPDPPVQYADWAVWQREQLHGEILEAHLRWWTERLAGAPRVLDLPTDRPRPPVEIPAGAILPLRLPEPLVEALRRLTAGAGATLYMALLAGFQALLARLAGQETVCTGTPVARRHRLEVEGLIGFFVNTVVIRSDVAGETGRGLVGHVRESVLGAFAHQDLPFERLVEALDLERDPRWSPLFQVSFILHNAPRVEPRLPGLAVELLDADTAGTGTTQFDLVVSLTESAETGGASGAIGYRTALFFETTIRRLARCYEALLHAMAVDPGRPVLDLPLLAEEERFQVLEEWGGSGSVPERAETFVSLFEAQVDRTPEAPAVLGAERSLTYRELDRRANQLARHLRSRGVGPESTVLLRLDRSPEILIALLGIWKAGGAYLPVDPGTPPERLAFLREDAAPAFELSPADLAVPAGSGERLDLHVDPDHLAYVIYTSGSTGRPKGVMITQRNLVTFALALSPVSGGEGLRCGLNASLAFDASVQILVQLLAGHSLWIVPEEARRDVDRLADFLREADLDVLDSTPSQLDLLLAAMDASRRPPRLLLVGGEPLPPAQARRLAFLPATRSWNVYGPTECTVDVTAGETGKGSDVGRPLGGSLLRLLDARGEPLPAGARGEVWIGGPQVGRGYLGRPDLTADRFRPDPFSWEPGARLYRTGDLGRWLPDGRIDLLGRADQQIKLRGFRIEIGEIEVSLAAHPGVREAAVDLLHFVAGKTAAGPILAAWVVPADLEALDRNALRRWLRERLPEAMIPSTFTVLDALPRTVSGKLDRRALPAPARTGEGGSVPPRDALELRLAELFQEVLGTAEIGVQESFFDLGGHSLAAIRLAARVRRIFGTALPVASLFAAPTVEALARLLREGGEIAASPLVPLRATGDREPLFLVHPAGGSVFGYLDLVRRLEPGRPIFGLQALDAGPAEVGEMAARYLAEVRRVQPDGPWHLVGWSFGGLVAFEMARQLREGGGEIAGLALIDPPEPLNHPTDPSDPSDRSDLSEAALLAAFAREPGIPRDLDPADLRRRFEIFRAHAVASRAFRPGAYDGPLDLFEAAGRPAPAVTWRGLARRVVVLPGDHYSLLVPPQVEALARALSGW